MATKGVAHMIRPLAEVVEEGENGDSVFDDGASLQPLLEVNELGDVPFASVRNLSKSENCAIRAFNSAELGGCETGLTPEDLGSNPSS